MPKEVPVLPRFQQLLCPFAAGELSLCSRKWSFESEGEAEGEFLSHSRVFSNTIPVRT